MGQLNHKSTFITAIINSLTPYKKKLISNQVPSPVKKEKKNQFTFSLELAIQIASSIKEISAATSIMLIRSFGASLEHEISI
jgi:hypothetical protein